MLTWWGIMLDVADFVIVPTFSRRNFDSLYFFFCTFKLVVVRKKTSMMQWKVDIFLNLIIS